MTMLVLFNEMSESLLVARVKDGTDCHSVGLGASSDTPAMHLLSRSTSFRL